MNTGIKNTSTSEIIEHKHHHHAEDKHDGHEEGKTCCGDCKNDKSNCKSLTNIANKIDHLNTKIKSYDNIK